MIQDKKNVRNSSKKKWQDLRKTYYIVVCVEFFVVERKGFDQKGTKYVFLCVIWMVDIVYFTEMYYCGDLLRF